MKMQKIKEKIIGIKSVPKSQEGYHYSSEILMRHGGFIIIFLNMIFGLLPVTFWEARVKYFKCSVSKLNATVATVCFIFFSFVFVRVVFFHQEVQTEDGKESLANLVVIMAMGVSYVVGYIVLLLRGHFVARKFPAVWTKLCKLFQLAVIDVYGKNYPLLKDARKFTRWAVCEFVGIGISTALATAKFSDEYENGIAKAISYYDLDLILPNERMNDFTLFERYQLFCLHIGYFIWQSWNSCHVLVTMLLCYIVIIITICLKSVNQQIQEVLETVCGKEDPELGVGMQPPKIRFNPSAPLLEEGTRLRSSLPLVYEFNEDVLSKRLDRARDVVLIIEELLGTVGKRWGIFLMVEVLILIASGTIETFGFLGCFKPKDDLSYRIPGEDEWVGVITTILVHFYFLFKCCILVDRMQLEARTTLQLLKQPSCQLLPVNIYKKVELLKNDLASTSFTLSASNYFQINKFLLTSVASQITTYVIVLLQFSQQDTNEK